jgi:hypothetical protein
MLQSSYDKHFIPRLIVLTMLVSGVCAAGTAGAVELYNAGPGTPPDQQNWKRLYYNDDSVNPADKADVALTGGVLDFDTLTSHDPSLSDGYFSKAPIDVPLTQQQIDQLNLLLPPQQDYIIENLESLIRPDHPDVPALDRTTGFEIRFTLRIAAEAHTTSDRAGFSLIVVTDDPAFGIEIGFWDNEVWAYDAPATSNGDFTHGEGAAFDTSGALHDYVLSIQGDSYTLTAPDPGGSDLSLSGNLRDYTIWGGVDLANVFNVPGIPADLVLQPYQIPNLIFFGDDTSSAEAHSELTTLALDLLTPLPDSIFSDGFEVTINQ